MEAINNGTIDLAFKISEIKQFLKAKSLPSNGTKTLLIGIMRSYFDL